MSIRQAYNSWAESYNEMKNKTRDLEEQVDRQPLTWSYKTIVELGCGTGKNTAGLLEKCDSMIALDFSEEMLTKTRKKINSSKFSFRKQDLTENWELPKASVDLLTCSLVLEHIKDLNGIFKKASKLLKHGGKFYISEFHPFKQYSGSKARFDNGNGLQELEVCIHHISDYTNAALKHGFKLQNFEEFFDDDDKKNVPRLVSFLFQKWFFLHNR